MIYIETGSTDVCYDFALEYYFTLEKRLSDTVFLFWRTTPTLMVGKYQNVLEEVDKPYADAHGIRIVRRMSGGGTIYTDLGGWQFSFIQHRETGRSSFPSTSCRCWRLWRRWGSMRPSTAATT